MIIQIVFYLLVFLVFIYYVTVAIHLLGMQVFQTPDISIGRALIPFYYWFKREVIK
jgi:hypothetical protein